jgi:hypothetical protein
MPEADVKKDSRVMDKAFRLSVEEIEGVLEKKRPITDRTRVAASTLSSYAKIKSTEIHDKALEMMVERKGSVRALPEMREE